MTYLLQNLELACPEIVPGALLVQLVELRPPLRLRRVAAAKKDVVRVESVVVSRLKRGGPVEEVIIDLRLH